MKIVYCIILAVLGLFGIFLCCIGVHLAVRAIHQGQLAAGNKHRVLAIITCVQSFAMLLVAFCAALALRRELKKAPPAPR